MKYKHFILCTKYVSVVSTNENMTSQEL